MANIGIDLMGGELAPHLLFHAVIQASKHLGPSFTLLALMTESAWQSLPAEQKIGNDSDCSKISFCIVDQVIEMEDDPLSAVRHKKNSSLVVGVRLLKKKKLDALVSLGNTGALITAATLMLSLMPGVRRPALLASLPAATGHVSILDVGGNVSYKAAQLTTLALMGACFERVHFGIQLPQVGLLNVGAESKKGTIEHRLAYQNLQELSGKEDHFKFIGNIEGTKVFQGDAHVIVTDGFSGNVLLKATEGVASYILDFLKKSSSQDHLKAMESHFSIDEHPGAVLLGVEGLVIKGHGSASPQALFNAIKAASSYIEKKLIEKLKSQLGSILVKPDPLQ